MRMASACGVRCKDRPTAVWHLHRSRCRLQSSCLLHRNSHRSHEKGFSFVWDLVCNNRRGKECEVCYLV